MTLPNAIIVSCHADNPFRAFSIHFSPIFFMMYRYYLHKRRKDTFMFKFIVCNSGYIIFSFLFFIIPNKFANNHPFDYEKLHAKKLTSIRQLSPI
jgi:hypothetical protein